MRKNKPVRAVKRARVKQPEPILLDPRVSIVQAASLHAMLLARVAGGGPVVIDASRVEEIDTAILQLLASLWRTCAERGIAFTWSAVSDTVRHAANLIGMTAMLQFPQSASAQDRRDAAA